MKKIFPGRQLFYMVVFVVSVFTACKKTETITITIQEPVARFAVLVPEPYNGYQNLGTSTYIDSNFYFRNTSDSGTNISYRWDFGDGAKSIDKNPRHSYSKRGDYKVTLTVSNEEKAFDTLQQTVSVILGQQHISLGDGTNVSPVAIEETLANEFVLLTSTGYGDGYNLFLLDSLLKQKSMKALPSSYRLFSMKATKDGNYIFTGSTQSSEKGNELIKMKADGSLLWNKLLFANDSYSYAAPTPDGGFAVIGSRSSTITGGNTNYNAVVVKTDANGNQQWQKFLDGEGMTNAADAVIEQDGIIISGIKRGNCLECDSILIVKLNNAGEVVWKNTVLGGLNNFVWWNTSITKLTNGNYAVTNGYTRGIFIFSTLGEFLDRKLASYQVAAVTNSGDGNMVVLQSEYGNGYRIGISKIMMDGFQLWYTYPAGWQKVQGGISCCSSSWPVNVYPLNTGGTITIGNRLNNNTNNSGSHRETVLLQLNEAGRPK